MWFNRCRPSSPQFFLQFHFKMEKMLPPIGGPPPPAGVKRPPPLMNAVDGHPGSDSMPPPPPGGMSIPPLPPGAAGAPHMPPHMPPMPMRPPPPDGLWSPNRSPSSWSRRISFLVCRNASFLRDFYTFVWFMGEQDTPAGHIVLYKDCGCELMPGNCF